MGARLRWPPGSGLCYLQLGKGLTTAAFGRGADKSDTRRSAVIPADQSAAVSQPGRLSCLSVRPSVRLIVYHLACHVMMGGRGVGDSGLRKLVAGVSESYSVLLLSRAFPWQKLLWRGRFRHRGVFFRHSLVLR